MTREEFNILDEWVFAEVKHNRDNYSRAKIIELIMERAEKLVNENDSLHLVSDTKLPKLIILPRGRDTAKEGNWYPIPEEPKTSKKEYFRGIITE